jgi:hypothetical protein
MAGRPRTMARKADRFEILAFNLADEIFRTIPKQYRQDPGLNDVVGQSWKECLDAAIHFWMMAGDLSMTLRDKAGLPEDGPTENCRLGDGPILTEPAEEDEFSGSDDFGDEDKIPPRSDHQEDR